MIHTVKAFSIVNEAEVDVFLEFSCSFYDPTVGVFSPGFGNGESERTTLGQSLQGLTILFLQSSLFIGVRNKELRAYS